MTSSQQTQLDSLYTSYTAKKALYDIEVLDNYKAHAGQSPNDPTGSGSDASLAAKKINMDNALAAYNQLFGDFTAANKAAFSYEHPELAANIAKSESEAEIASAQIKANAMLEQQSKQFMQKNTQYLIITAIVLTVIVVGIIVWKKVLHKA